ncbi:MAG: hypothetical protein GY699_08095 [Desulfobacteraceae bacterium]|nr:hypothetical protein [Desulfobacteraceae bacterium]
MNKKENLKKTEHLHQSFPQPIIASIAQSNTPGKVMVQYNSHEPKPAKLISGIDRYQLSQEQSIGTEVLIVFENGDPDLPIITGVMENFLDEIISEQENLKTIVDGKEINIEAKEKIVLKCGKGSITIDKHGKIIIKGEELISRSSGSNKIKGGSIQLN